MDPITQGALGAAVAQAALFNQDKKRAYIAGGLAGMAADLDILIRSSQDPLLSLIYHRNFTHSLFFIPFGALLVALALLMFKSFRTQWRWVFAACLLGYATHGALDVLTSYGTVFFWPFSNQRLSLDYISIIDPFFTLPIILGLTWGVIYQKRRPVLLGLGLAALFLILNIFQHHRVINAVRTYAKQQDIQPRKLRAFPALASSTYWRVLYISNGHFQVVNVNTPWFGQSRLQTLQQYPVYTEKMLPDFVKNSTSLLRDYHVFHWFSDGYLFKSRSKPLTLVDGRYLIGSKPLTALWGVTFVPGHRHVIKMNRIPLEK